MRDNSDSNTQYDVVRNLLGSGNSTVNNLNYSLQGMILTLIVNLVIFVVLLIVFEINRFYKQIFLKRYQKRYINSLRVPEPPPDHLFGWFFAIFNVSEYPDFLTMVGLDAYMLLRYHVLCIKLALFLSLWGLIVLIPTYGTVPTEHRGWDKYTLLNVVAGELQYQSRLWVTSITFYLFAAYFCQLLYAEYLKFSDLRLQYLSKDDPNDDPDTHPQTYYTIMLESIPHELRSAEKLAEYFEDFFPGEVYTVELSLDLRELNALTHKRRNVRDKLEKAIAIYNVTAPKRPTVKVKTRDSSINLFEDDRGDISFSAFIDQFTNSSRYGYEPLDAINYYTAQLRMLNDEVMLLQAKCFEKSRSLDKDIKRRLKNKYDSRAAEAVQQLGQKGKIFIDNLSKNRQKIDTFFFSPSVKGSNDGNSKTKRRKAKKGKSNPSYAPTADTTIVKRASSGYSTIPIVNPLHQEDAEEGDSGKSSDILNMSGSNLMSYAPFSKLTEEEVDVDGNEEAVGDGSGGINIEDDSSSDSDSSSDEENETRTEGYVVEVRDEEAVIEAVVTTKAHATIGVQFAATPEVIPAERKATPPMSVNQRLFAQATDDGSKHSSPAGLDDDATTVKRDSLTISMVESIALDKTKQSLQQGWDQTKIAGLGFALGMLEAQKTIEMVVVGAHYNYSSTAFVTFKTRMAETIAHQMNLSDECSMEIHHAPNTNDIIWENISIPKSQIYTRTVITNIGLTIGAFFWSSLTNSVNHFARTVNLPEKQQNYISVCILLIFLVILPFIFDFISRYYECLKLESEIQNSIMTRYFYYQLVNIYVTVGLGGIDIGVQLLSFLKNPQMLVQVLGGTIPSVSLYFCNLVIVKIFTAIPLEMLRPWQLSSIALLGTFMDRRKTTRRELRTGAFYAWPMLYGWIYPQLMMVQMIVIVYASICPLLMPLGAVFFAFAYIMYKYQLLYVYVNNYQSHGFMWYQVFNFSIIGLLFASCTLLGYLGLHVQNGLASGPFFFLLPLPVCVIYYWNYCVSKFKKKSMDLSFQRAKYIDNINQCKREKQLPLPHDMFKKHLFRQPTLTENPQYPEPYRKSVNDEFLDNTSRRSSAASIDYESHTSNRKSKSPVRGRNRAQSINVDVVQDDLEDNEQTLYQYFHDVVLGTLCKRSHHPCEIYREVSQSQVLDLLTKASNKSNKSNDSN